MVWARSDHECATSNIYWQAAQYSGPKKVLVSGKWGAFPNLLFAHSSDHSLAHYFGVVRQQKMCKPLFRSATTQLDDEECDDNYEEPGTRIVMFHGPALNAQDILHFGTRRARFGSFRAPLAPLDLLPLLPLGLCPFGRVRRWFQSDERPRRLIPILLYLDGAVTGQFDKMQVEAMKMTLGTLNRKARDREHAWRTIGY